MTVSDGWSVLQETAGTLAGWSQTDARAATIDVLLEELERLPSQPSAAFQVLRLVEEDNPSLSDVARVVATDPALTLRVVRMANGAWFGRTTRVSSPAAAVAVLGLETLRWLAASAAAGLATEDSPMPDGFWAHGGATAVAAGLLAPRLGIPRSDAFCLGLLHNLGLALLHRADPEGHPLLVEGAPAGGTAQAEREVYGIGHDEAAARVLSAWGFAEPLCEAVGAHHEPAAAGASAHARCLTGARALVRGLPGVPAHEDVDDPEVALRAAAVRPEEVAGLRGLIEEQSARLAAALDGA